jgi:CTP:molybdopterin cytidylyltransferase MocA
MGRIAAIVLAAGEASRFGSAKQLLFLPRVLERLQKTSVDEVVVVEGAHPLDLPTAGSPRAVECPNWEHGPGASLHCGLAALGNDVDAAVVILADGPDLSPASVERVVDAWRESRGVVAASYDGSRGHPLVVGREGWTEIPDEGLRAQAARLVPCDDLGAPGDVDIPADLPKGL